MKGAGASAAARTSLTGLTTLAAVVGSAKRRHRARVVPPSRDLLFIRSEEFGFYALV